MDPEYARRFRSIARVPCEGAGNQHLLEPGGSRRQIFIRPIDCSLGCRASLIDKVEIGGVDRVTAHQHRSALHRLVVRLTPVRGCATLECEARLFRLQALFLRKPLKSLVFRER